MDANFNFGQFNNTNDSGDAWVLLIFGIFIFITFIICLLFLFNSRKRTTTTGGEFGGGEYSDYENMTDAQLAAAETDAASNFYDWNESQFVSLSGENAPGDLSSRLPINVPNLISNMAAAVALDPGLIGRELRLIKNIAVRTGRLVQCRATTLCAKLLVKGGEKLLVRLGVKAAAKALTVAATRFAVALGTKLQAAASTGPAAPIVAIAEFVFAATLGLLDQFGVGGYTELVPSSVYEGMRDEYDRAFRENTINEGYEWPVIAGPGDKLSQEQWEAKISAGYDVIFNDTSHPATVLFIQLYNAMKRQVGRELTDAECQTLLQTQGLGKAIEDAVMSWVATDLGGKAVRTPSGNVYCSYSSSAAVDASFHWPLSSEYENEVYSEWDEQNQVAYVRQSAMRTFAEQLGNGCTYNKQTRVPNITEAFCRSNGLDYANGQCKYAEGQEIAEMIFGKTFIRGLTQVFDVKQYESCSDKEMCKGSDPCTDDGYFCRISRLAYTRNPKGPIGCKPGFELTSPGSGLCKNECPTDGNGKWQMYAGLCYHPSVTKMSTGLFELTKVPTYGSCPSDFRTEPATCFRDASCRTYIGCTSYTPNWWPIGGGRCVEGPVTTCTPPESQPRPRTCPAGYSERAGMCYAVSMPLNAQVFSAADPNYGGCPSGQEAEGLLCYDPCPSNYTKVTGGLMCTPNDGFKVKIEAKRRKIAFSTPDFAGSPVGQRVQQIKEAGETGDVGRLGAGLGCLFLATNPIINGLGLQDFSNMIPDPATGQGVQQR